MSEPSIDDVYTERNRCVALAARLAISNGLSAWLAKHESDPWDDDWRTIVFIDLPSGQVSWHIHDSEVHLFDGLPWGENCWDGHTTEEKYERCSSYTS